MHKSSKHKSKLHMVIQYIVMQEAISAAENTIEISIQSIPNYQLIAKEINKTISESTTYSITHRAQANIAKTINIRNKALRIKSQRTDGASFRADQ